MYYFRYNNDKNAVDCVGGITHFQYLGIRFHTWLPLTLCVALTCCSENVLPELYTSHLFCFFFCSVTAYCLR